MTKPTPLLESTKSSMRLLTDLFDFVWPAAAGMWNMRWQVSGFMGAHGNATESDLHSRFILGSGIRGTNLRRTCIETTWNEQQEHFARILLFNIFALYELWADAACRELGAAASKDLVKNLQYPSATVKGKAQGISAALIKLDDGNCLPLQSELAPIAAAAESVHVDCLDELLCVYRLFKELRNSITHRGGCVDAKIVDAHAAVVAMPRPLPFRAPKIDLPVVGSPIQVTLYEMVALTDLVRRTMLSIDARLWEGCSAKRLLLKRWKAFHGRRTFLPASREKRTKRLRGAFVKIGAPRPDAIVQLERMLSEESLIF